MSDIVKLESLLAVFQSGFRGSFDEARSGRAGLLNIPRELSRDEVR